MPKEYVRDLVGCFDVRIGWERNGLVQVATEMREPTSSDGPQNLSDLVATWTDEDSRGLFATLDRAGVNDLIRHLRRARDQAFGRDE